MILYRIVIYSSLVEQRGRGEMCVWLFRHEMEGYLLYRNAITSLFAWFYAEDRLQLPSWPLNLARLWEEQVGRTILWPLGISFTSEVRNVLFCLSYDQSQIVTLTALIRNIYKTNTIRRPLQRTIATKSETKSASRFVNMYIFFNFL